MPWANLILITISNVLLSSALDLQETAPGPVACKNLTNILGHNKVAHNVLELDYFESRSEYYNLRQSKYKPSCVVYPTSSEDVSKTILAIKASGSRFAIRSGGHNTNNFFSSVDEGVLIDLRKLNHKSYDPLNQWATFGPGHTFSEVYEYFDQYKCAIVGARIAGVGTGLALGGGLSHLSPQFGLACDNFRILTVVLPNGTIVTASEKENQNLFFALKGGGGNAYGIVTEYTVQCRPSGIFYAGNIICQISKETVINRIGQALADFTQYNTDPKAAIIGTIEVIGTPPLTPDIAPNITFIFFGVYDGQNPGNAFENFTSLEFCISTMGPKSYLDAVNLPLPGTAQLSRGDNQFRVQVHDIQTGTWKNAFRTWMDWAHQEKGNFVLLSLDWQPIAQSLIVASKAQGGNAYDMPNGPLVWLNYLLTANPLLLPNEYNALQSRYRDMVNKTPNAPGKPLFLNDAHVDQNPLCTFSTLSRLQEIKKYYDPDGFFSNKTGGWCFDCC